MNLDRIFSVKNVSYATLFLNLISIILGIVYLITISVYSVIWDILGIIYLITLFGNFLLVYLDSVKINKKNSTGKRLNYLGYFYLISTSFAMIGMFLSNFSISGSYSYEFFSNITFYMIIYLSYFGLLTFGTILAYLNIKNINNSDLWTPVFSQQKTKLLMKIVKLFCYLFLVMGLFLTLITLFGASLGQISGVIGMFVAQLGLFLSFIFLSVTITLLKLKNRKTSPRSYYGVAIIGLIISSILLLPLISTPYSIYSGDQNFTEAFGSWKSKIPPDIVNQYFLQTPFSIPEYFLGVEIKEFNVSRDVLYFDADGIKLYFDVYRSLGNASDLPGNNSILIRIHGGAKNQGDKGSGNMMEMNKYFAAQGYVVFDIQYGLSNRINIPVALPTPDYVIGDFGLDDIVSHIGNFTFYLADHAAEYGANLDSVFVSGGSAGGHLTCITALAIANGSFPSIFSENLTIKGYIPYYPNLYIYNETDAINENATQEFIRPQEYLINETTPPALCFHGEQDGLNKPIHSQTLKNAYTAAGNNHCAIIWFPFAGHANDLYFQGHYNQVFLYFMERFMYLCNNDLI